MSPCGGVHLLHNKKHLQNPLPVASGSGRPHFFFFHSEFNENMFRQGHQTVSSKKTKRNKKKNAYTHKYTASIAHKNKAVSNKQRLIE